MVTSEQVYEVLNETFTLRPKGEMKTVLNSEGENLYTSEELKNDFKEIINSQKLLKPAAPSIDILIDKDIVVPVVASKSVMGMISRKLLAPQHNKLILGFYHHLTGKIYILLENHTSFIYWVNEEDIASVLLHEFQHLLAKVYKKEFLTLHKDPLISYYQSFYNQQFQIELTDNDSFEIANWVFNNYELDQETSMAILMRYAEFLEGIFSKYSKEDVSPMISDLLTIVKIYMHDFRTFLNLVMSRNKDVIKVVTNLIRSYKAIGIMNPHSLCIQELWAPSEIICIESQNNTKDRHYTLIDKYAKTA